MQVTGSTNIKAFSKAQSYKGLRENHFDNEDRAEKGISKDEDLEKLNRHFEFLDVRKVYDGLEKRIENYNAKPSQQKNKSRQYANLSDYIEKRRGRQRVNKDFHGVEFMMVSKIGSMESWNEIVKRFEENGVSEEETLNCLNKGFEEFGKEFNRTFGNAGLFILEADTNLDEQGAPHMHARVMNVNTLKNGLLDTNLASGLRKMYGKKTNKELLEDFRLEVDEGIIYCGSESLKKLAKEHGFEFEGLEMIRTHAADKGLTHEAYKEKQERIKRQEHLDSLSQQIEQERKDLETEKEAFEAEKLEFSAKKKQVEDKEKTLKPREDAVAASEASLKKKGDTLRVDQEKARLARLAAEKAKEDAETAEIEARTAKIEAEAEKQKYKTKYKELAEEFNGKLDEATALVADARMLDKGFVEFLMQKHSNEKAKNILQKWVEEYEQRQNNAMTAPKKRRMANDFSLQLEIQKQKDEGYTF